MTKWLCVCGCDLMCNSFQYAVLKKNNSDLLVIDLTLVRHFGTHFLFYSQEEKTLPQKRAFSQEKWLASSLNDSFPTPDIVKTKRPFCRKGFC